MLFPIPIPIPIFCDWIDRMDGWIGLDWMGTYKLSLFYYSPTPPHAIQWIPNFIRSLKNFQGDLILFFVHFLPGFGVLLLRTLAWNMEFTYRSCPFNLQILL